MGFGIGQARFARGTDEGVRSYTGAISATRGYVPPSKDVTFGGSTSNGTLVAPEEVRYPSPVVCMFSAHPNLADEVNRGIIQSEIEGGVFLNDLPPSTVLEIQTLHHCYRAVMLGGCEALLSGHPEFCPEPVQVAISGSTWGGSMLKLQFVGRGMHLEFRHPQYPMPIVTSPIQEIRDNQALPPVELDTRAHGAHS